MWLGPVLRSCSTTTSTTCAAAICRSGPKTPERPSREALYARRLGSKQPQTYELYREIFETRPPEVLANIAICLVNQANYLIDRQIARLEKDFLEQGGLRERMTRARLEHRAQQDGTHRSHGSSKTSKSPSPNS